MKKFKKILGLFTVILMTLSLSATALAQGGDTENPTDVNNLSGVPLNGSAKLTWAAASDDTAVTGYQVHYGLTPVDEPGETYDQSEDAGNVTEYVVGGLTNGETYYFSVVAYDAAGNESISWAPEVSVTPDESASSNTDTEAPTVKSAESKSIEEVKIIFSEAVTLPTEFPEDAFVIENNDTFEPLAIKGAVLDEDDEAGLTVILSTDPQAKDIEYTLTVGIDIKDKAGNPIISGTSDTALFTGTDTPKVAEDTTPPVLVSIESIDKTHVVVNFDETVVVSIDPSQNFSIVAEDDATQSLEILGIELGRNEAGVEESSVLVTTSPQEEKSYLLVVSGITDAEGNEVSPSLASGTFMGMAEVLLPDDTADDDDDDDAMDDVIDTKVTSDVANFLAKGVFKAGEYMVKLTWSFVAEDRAHVASQNLYMSKDKGANYKKNKTLDADVKEYEVKGLEAGEYWFKVTQVDEEGNETEGATAKVIISETGPEMLGLLLVSIGLGGFFKKKRR